jgi:hypothetical protein
MTDIGPTGYLSDGEIIAWLEQKSDDQYTDLRQQMKDSSERSDLTKALADLGSTAQRDQGSEANFDRIQQVQQQYANSSEATDIDPLLLHYEIKLLAGMPDGAEKISGIADAIDASPISADQKAQLHDYLNQAQSVLYGTADDHTTASFVAAATSPSTFTQFGDDIKNITDDLGRIDQLDLIKIQQTVSDAKQTDQLASNILSSRDQTSNSIVGNIGRG